MACTSWLVVPDTPCYIDALICGGYRFCDVDLDQWEFTTSVAADVPLCGSMPGSPEEGEPGSFSCDGGLLDAAVRDAPALRDAYPARDGSEAGQ
jgi:hypothetical protein